MTRNRRRSFSLRARVAAAAALVAAIIVMVLGAITFSVIRHNNIVQIDRQLEAASLFVQFRPEPSIRVLTMLGEANPLFAITEHNGDATVSSTPVELPQRPVGTDMVNIGGTVYRMKTVERTGAPGHTVAIGESVNGADRTTSQQRHWVLWAAGLSIFAAGGLGWLLGGRAVRPIVELTHRVGSPGRELPLPMVGTSGVREADELADAVTTMLGQVSDAQAESAAALATARDFAAASAHELRTPLTAMRTDIEVLRTLDLDLDPAQRTEVLNDLQRAQGRVEATLTALERLATGELTSDRDYTDTDVAELCDLAAHDAMRHNPNLTVRVDTDQELTVRGLPAGLRLAVDNAISNAARHGKAHTVELAAHRNDNGRLIITIDDDGVGLPAAERDSVFARFARGSTATQGGSGLGLALVAQQAQLHGGRAYFADSPLGGARLVLDLNG